MKIKRNEDIFYRKEIEGEEELKDFLESEDVSAKGYITLIEAGTMHQLNYLGGRIWENCDGSKNLDGIVKVLEEEFDVEEEQLKTDVEDFIEDMIERGWLLYE
jgi:pyrroloquinoline quinone biosynthesis protein D